MSQQPEKVFIKHNVAGGQYARAYGDGFTKYIDEAYAYSFQSLPDWYNSDTYDLINADQPDSYGKPAFQQVEEALGYHLRDYTSEERKACPVTTGVLQYFPDALMAIARVSKAGNEKHNPGEPLHWARGKSNDHADCEGRHLLTPDAKDPDSNQPERAHKAWRALADLQIAEEKRLVALGIKPLSGVFK